MSYKLRRMKKIAEKHGDTLNRVAELYKYLLDTYGSGSDWANIEDTKFDEYDEKICKCIEEIRDDFVLSEKVAIRYFFDALRLRQRGKI